MQRTVIVDDITGEELKDGMKKVKVELMLSHDGQDDTFTLDLSEVSLQALVALLNQQRNPMLKLIGKPGEKPKAKASSGKSKASTETGQLWINARAWANENGVPVGSKGNPGKAVINGYQDSLKEAA